MKNKKHIQNEIVKLRKLSKLKSASPLEQERAWISMLTLQWVLMNEKKIHPITPSIICKPNLSRWEIK